MKVKTIIVLGSLALTAILPIQVMAQNTETNPAACGFICRIQRVFRRDNAKNNNPVASEMPTPTGSDAPGLMANPKTRLDQAVKNGKITQVQADEIVSRLNIINTKQKELNDLEKSLAEYMKTNNIAANLLGRRPAPAPIQSPQATQTTDIQVTE